MASYSSHHPSSRSSHHPSSHSSNHPSSHHSHHSQRKEGGTPPLPSYTKELPPSYTSKQVAAETIVKSVKDGNPILEPVIVHDYEVQGKSWTSTRTIIQRHPGALYRGQQSDAFRAFNCNVSKIWLQRPKILWLRTCISDRTEELIKREIEKQHSIVTQKSFAVAVPRQMVQFLENELKGQFGKMEDFSEGHYSDFIDSIRNN